MSIKIFNQKLKEIRRAKNLTQQEIADKIGINQGYVVQIEQGIRNPSIRIVSKLEHILGLNNGDLIKEKFCSRCNRKYDA